MGFKTTKRTTVSTESPEALLRDLRGRKIAGMLAHQADVTRDYVKLAVKAPDVALQLPTGSGKTLVGLLIGEWRRRNFGDRVVYLCPTNQLVHQVVEQANQRYGLSVRAFTGQIRDYEPGAKSEYHSAEAIAVTSYSALFNSNPFFSNPQTIILDDAHAAENYIASFWTLKIERFNEAHAAAYSILSSALKPVLPPIDYTRMVGNWNSDWDKTWVDLIPGPIVRKMIPEIVAILDECAGKSDLKYPWEQIRDRLQACNLFVSSQEIAIRPLIPPTETHRPFANATQRIYMSATLGSGGDLERLTGRSRIERLPVPPGWDKQGIGRRFFMFPGRSLNANEGSSLVLDLMRKAGRTLVLTPSEKTADAVRNEVKQKLRYQTFTAQEIEQSKKPFVESKKAVAVIANRYDGIDLADEDCRLLVAIGLPRATNLQERFLISRMSAIILLNDRILTRVVQAIGRCTRSPNDYSAVVVWGEELLNFLLNKDRRGFLHPELQAEIEFGILQSKDATADQYLEYFDFFVAQGNEWRAADSEIVSLRSDMLQKSLPGLDGLSRAAPHEVAFMYAMWQGDFASAVEHARKVLTELVSPDLRGYRALWCYLAGSAAEHAAANGVSSLRPAVEMYFTESRKAAPNIPWLSKLARADEQDTEAADQAQVLKLVERMESVLERLGVMHDRDYVHEERAILAGLLSRDPTAFEESHTRLGQLLGFDAGNKNSSGAPDPWWIVDDQLCFIFEDHSGASAGSRLSTTKARQVATHPTWVRAKLPISQNAVVLPILVTPVTAVEADALPHLVDVAIWHIDEFEAWAKQALGVIRDLRKTFSEPGDLEWRARAAAAYESFGISPRRLAAYFRDRMGRNVLKS